MHRSVIFVALVFWTATVVRADITGFPFSSGTTQCADFNSDWPVQATTLTTGVNNVTCSWGSLTTQAEDDFLRITNMYRRYAGLDPVQNTDTTGSVNAQACALLCNANGKIQHTGWSTGDKCYTTNGTAGCASSNLASGVAQPNDIMSLWIDDGNTAGSLLGHRRWILNPSLGDVGYGLADRYSAMYVFGSQSYTTSLGWYSWPPQGLTPLGVLWSTTDIIFHYANVNFTSEPQIVNCQVCDATGASVRVGGCWADSPGYGDWGTIMIKTQIPGAGCYSVNLSFKTASDAAVQSVSYVAELYDCDTSGGGATCFGAGPVTCIAPSAANKLFSWVGTLSQLLAQIY